MKISVASDLHLEYQYYDGLKKKFLGDHNKEVLVLAGDIIPASIISSKSMSSESKWLRNWIKHDFRQMTMFYEKIIMVMGNHDYYDSLFADAKKIIEDEMADLGIDNLVILDNQSIIIRNMRFVGCSLWTDYNRGDPHLMLNAKEMVNDYKRMKVSPEFLYKKHQESMEWLEFVFKTPTEQHFYGVETPKTVVVTHHAPTFKSCDPRYGNEMSGLYASDVSDYIHNHPEIMYWFHGHTHYPIDYEVGRTRIISNPVGRVREEVNKQFTVKQYEIVP